MNSTRASSRPGLPFGFVLALLALSPAWGSSSSAIPRPPELERDVRFWVRVYTEIDTNDGFLHDDGNLAVVYETLRFERDTTPRQRQKIVEAARDQYIAALKRIAARSGLLSKEDQRIRDMWGDEGTPARLREATTSIRFQLGQSDRFHEGLVRSGAWEAHIAQTIANMGLPPEIAALPHVESSFNPAAYSKVGAAGLWQFMRSTGRRYMRIDSEVDDRMDPFRSTEAAAQLLAYNYRVLGTWPLALTAYNHGAAGMRRAKNTMGTDDIVKIVRGYRSRTFGFASRNFYVSFLAALDIDRNAEKYFGPIERLPEARFQEVELPAYIPVEVLESTLNIERQRLRTLNPALLPVVWAGHRHVPKGYRLRLPADGEQWTPDLLATRLDASQLYAGQPRPSSHRVQRGETLGLIAQRYGVSVRTLADLNNMRVNSILRAGRDLVVPEAPARTIAAARAQEEAAPTPPAVAVATGEGARVYVVRRGDALSEIAKKTGVSEAELLRINRIRNPDFIFEGQQLRLSLAPAVAAARPAAEPAPASGPEVSGGVSAIVAQRESEEDAAAVKAVGEPSEKAEPVSAAQAEALSPALGPGVETPQSADAIDYSVAEDDTIQVAAAETLGHYAEWLDIRASQLRQINRMSYGRPVLIGHKIKLDFGKVSRDTFEERRREYHRVLQASYFAAHRIIGTEIYIARRGDSLWTVTQRYSRMPVWLLQQYNPDVDFSSMQSGTQIVVPRIEAVGTTEG